MNGVDTESLSIMNDIINKKGTLKEISEWHGASLNQVNKLSRLVGLHNKCSYLEDKLLDKLKGLGLKALVLSPVADNQDAMFDILSSIDINVKRDDLALLPGAYQEKIKAIDEAKSKADYMLAELDVKEKKIEEKIKAMKILKAQADSALEDFKDMTEKGKKFILEHVGLYQGKYILKRRLDIAWQKNLKRKGVLDYDIYNYVTYIKDMEDFKKQVEKRIKNGNYMRFDPMRKPEWECYAYNGEEYKRGNSMIISITSQLDSCVLEINSLNQEKKKINREINKLKKESSTNYIQQAIVSNQLSANDLIKHTRLQNEAMKFLFKDGYATVTEIAVDNYRFDTIGFNNDSEIVVVEAKASMSDLKNDKKMESYLNYCNKLYLIIDSNVFYSNHNSTYIFDRLQKSGTGLLISHCDNSIEIILQAVTNNKLNKDIKQDIIFKIARKLSDKYIYALKKN